MRKLTKGPAPQVLIDNAEIWTTELEGAVDDQAKKAVQKRYRNQEIRDALVAETQKKCAYCESIVGATDYSHIEHIFPKDTFVDGTFRWENLTISCPMCNGKKRNVAPTANNFIHPYNDEPEQRIKFSGAIAHPRGGDLAAGNFIRWLDLNRTAILERRKDVFERVQSAFEAASRLQGEARVAFLWTSVSELTAPDSEFSQVAKCAVEIFQKEYNLFVQQP
jgi:uncharacterized protein (TIGR02646 family)